MSGREWDRLIVAVVVAFLAGFATMLVASETLDDPADRDAIRHQAITVEPPTRETTDRAILHACREADVSLGALVERLEQTGIDWSEVADE